MFYSWLAAQIEYPAHGILQQAYDALHSEPNATIGIALDDNKVPLVLPSMLSQTTLDPTCFTYTSSFGLPKLRKLRQQRSQKQSPHPSCETSLPVVTNGLTHGLSICFQMFADQDTSLILPEYHRGNYKLIYATQGKHNIQTYRMFADGWLDLTSFASTITSLTKKSIILLNFPNNPTGYMPTLEEYTTLVSILIDKAKDLPLIVICDDAYAWFAYTDTAAQSSFFYSLAGKHENILTIKLDGASKELYARWARVGFISYACTHPHTTLDDLVSKTWAFVRWSLSNVSHINQHMVYNTLTSPTYEQEKTYYYRLLQERYKETCRVLANQKYSIYFSPLPFNAWYFMAIRLHEHSTENIRKRLLKQHNIGVISFAQSNVLRIAYSCVAKEHIAYIFEKVYEVCEDG